MMNDELKKIHHSSFRVHPSELVDGVGIAPTFSALQTDANLSQLTVQLF
jgi:hypothetical protein